MDLVVSHKVAIIHQTHTVMTDGYKTNKQHLHAFRRQAITGYFVLCTKVSVLDWYWPFSTCKVLVLDQLVKSGIGA